MSAPGGQDTRDLILERLRADQSFVLVTHEHPDGDALGSLIGMHGLLKALGKRSEMFISPHDLPLPREYRLLPLDGLVARLKATDAAVIMKLGRNFAKVREAPKTRGADRRFGMFHRPDEAMRHMNAPTSRFNGRNDVGL